MQGQPNISWRGSQKQKLSKAVSKYNAKITRETKRNPQFADYYPKRTTVTEQKELIKTAKDLNAFVASVDRVFKVGAFTPVQTEKGIKTTTYEIKETKLKVDRINRARAKERKKADVSTEKGTMGTIKSNNLTPKKFNINKIKSDEWEKYKLSVEKMSRYSYNDEKKEKYKQIYLESITRFLGEASRYEDLKTFVETLDNDLLYEKYYDDPILSIAFTSDPLPANEIVEQIFAHWHNVMNE